MSIFKRKTAQLIDETTPVYSVVTFTPILEGLIERKDMGVFSLEQLRMSEPWLFYRFKLNILELTPGESLDISLDQTQHRYRAVITYIIKGKPEEENIWKYHPKLSIRKTARTKFKVGDKVVCANSDDSRHLLKHGEIYTVKGIIHDRLYLREIPEWGFYSDRFELIEPVEEPENIWVNPPKLSIRKEAQTADYNIIWDLGKKISGGYGFWGSGGLSRHRNPEEMVRAWVDALREKGYSDFDIVFYGDWRDARHIADCLDRDTTYREFKNFVSSQVTASVEYVHSENEHAYSSSEVDLVKRGLGKLEPENIWVNIPKLSIRKAQMPRGVYPRKPKVPAEGEVAEPDLAPSPMQRLFTALSAEEKFNLFLDIISKTDERFKELDSYLHSDPAKAVALWSEIVKFILEKNSQDLTNHSLFLEDIFKFSPSDLAPFLNPAALVFKFYTYRILKRKELVKELLFVKPEVFSLYAENYLKDDPKLPSWASDAESRTLYLAELLWSINEVINANELKELFSKLAVDVKVLYQKAKSKSRANLVKFFESNYDASTLGVTLKIPEEKAPVLEAERTKPEYPYVPIPYQHVGAVRNFANMLNLVLQGAFLFEKKASSVKHELSIRKTAQLEPLVWDGIQGHKHLNGGGFVADTAHVDETAYVSENAKVFENARVSGDAKVYRNAQVSGNAIIFGNARVSGNAIIFGNARVSGDAYVSGNAEVYGDAYVSGNVEIASGEFIKGDIRVQEDVEKYGKDAKPAEPENIWINPPKLSIRKSRLVQSQEKPSTPETSMPKLPLSEKPVKTLSEGGGEFYNLPPAVRSFFNKIWGSEKEPQLNYVVHITKEDLKQFAKELNVPSMRDPDNPSQNIGVLDSIFESRNDWDFDDLLGLSHVLGASVQFAARTKGGYPTVMPHSVRVFGPGSSHLKYGTLPANEFGLHVKLLDLPVVPREVIKLVKENNAHQNVQEYKDTIAFFEVEAFRLKRPNNPDKYVWRVIESQSDPVKVLFSANYDIYRTLDKEEETNFINSSPVFEEALRKAKGNEKGFWESEVEMKVPVEKKGEISYRCPVDKKIYTPQELLKTDPKSGKQFLSRTCPEHGDTLVKIEGAPTITEVSKTEKVSDLFSAFKAKVRNLGTQTPFDFSKEYFEKLNQLKDNDRMLRWLYDGSKLGVKYLLQRAIASNVDEIWIPPAEYAQGKNWGGKWSAATEAQSYGGIATFFGAPTELKDTSYIETRGTAFGGGAKGEIYDEHYVIDVKSVPRELVAIKLSIRKTSQLEPKFKVGDKVMLDKSVSINRENISRPVHLKFGEIYTVIKTEFDSGTNWIYIEEDNGIILPRLEKRFEFVSREPEKEENIWVNPPKLSIRKTSQTRLLPSIDEIPFKLNDKVIAKEDTVLLKKGKIYTVSSVGWMQAGETPVSHIGLSGIPGESFNPSLFTLVEPENIWANAPKFSIRKIAQVKPKFKIGDKVRTTKLHDMEYSHSEGIVRWIGSMDGRSRYSGDEIWSDWGRGWDETLGVSNNPNILSNSLSWIYASYLELVEPAEPENIWVNIPKLSIRKTSQYNFKPGDKVIYQSLDVPKYNVEGGATYTIKEIISPTALTIEEAPGTWHPSKFRLLKEEAKVEPTIVEEPEVDAPLLEERVPVKEIAEVGDYVKYLGSKVTGLPHEPLRYDKIYKVKKLKKIPIEGGTAVVYALEGIEGFGGFSDDFEVVSAPTQKETIPTLFISGGELVKKGDKVVPVSVGGMSPLELGKIYTIRKVSEDHIYLEEIKGGFYPHRFRLARPKDLEIQKTPEEETVRETEPSFTADDKVRALQSYGVIEKDKVYEVLKVTDKNTIRIKGFSRFEFNPSLFEKVISSERINISEDDYGIVEDILKYISQQKEGYFERDPSYPKISDTSLTSELFWSHMMRNAAADQTQDFEKWRKYVSENGVPILSKDLMVFLPNVGTFSWEYYAVKASSWVQNDLSRGISPMSSFETWELSNLGKQIENHPRIKEMILKYLGDRLNYVA